MLTLEYVKELANDPSLSDDDIKQIRDEFYTLAEIVFEQWMHERKMNNEKPIPSNSSNAGI